jgi:hypothetical protein
LYRYDERRTSRSTPSATSGVGELPDSESQEEVAELLGFLEVGHVGGVLEPHERLARCLQLARIPLCRVAGRHPVEATLHHDDRNREAGNGVEQVEGGELGHQSGLGRADPPDVRTTSLIE